MKPDNNITVGELRMHLSGYSDDYILDFNGLTFYRLKQRGEKLVQVEFNETVYKGKSGRIVIEQYNLN